MNDNMIIEKKFYDNMIYTSKDRTFSLHVGHTPTNLVTNSVGLDPAITRKCARELQEDYVFEKNDKKNLIDRKRIKYSNIFSEKILDMLHKKLTDNIINRNFLFIPKPPISSYETIAVEEAQLAYNKIKEAIINKNKNKVYEARKIVCEGLLIRDNFYELCKLGFGYVPDSGNNQIDTVLYEIDFLEAIEEISTTILCILASKPYKEVKQSSKDVAFIRDILLVSPVGLMGNLSRLRETSPVFVELIEFIENSYNIDMFKNKFTTLPSIIGVDTVIVDSWERQICNTHEEFIIRYIKTLVAQVFNLFLASILSIEAKIIYPVSVDSLRMIFKIKKKLKTIKEIDKVDIYLEEYGRISIPTKVVGINGEVL